MGVRMKAPWDDGTVALAVGEEHFDFPPRLEARLVRSGLAEALPVKSLDHARVAAGMERIAAPEIETPSMTMTKAELLLMAEERGIEVESDDNKSELVRKIEAAE